MSGVCVLDASHLSSARYCDVDGNDTPENEIKIWDFLKLEAYGLPARAPLLGLLHLVRQGYVLKFTCFAMALPNYWVRVLCLGFNQNNRSARTSLAAIKVNWSW